MRVLAAVRLPQQTAFLDFLRSIEGCELVCTCDRLDQVPAAVRAHDPDLLILGRHLEDATDARLLQALPEMRAASQCRIIVLISRDLEGLSAAIEAAGAEPYAGDIAPDDVCRWITEGQASPVPASVEAVPVPDPLPGSPPPPRPAAPVVAVYGASGGVGTTTIALNLAVRAQAAGQRTCLVDFNLQSPNLHCHLQLPLEGGERQGIDPDCTLYGLWPALESGRLTPAGLQDRLLTADGGLRVLPGPLYDLARIQRLDADRLEELLDRLAGSGDFDLVVADTAPLPALPGTFAAMTRATHIAWVTTNLAAHIHDAGALLHQVWDRLGIPRRKYRVVINQFREGLCTPEDTATTLDLNPVQVPTVTIPFDTRGLVHLASQQGLPLARTHPGHVLPARLDTLLGSIVPGLYPAAAAAQNRRRSLWGRWT